MKKMPAQFLFMFMSAALVYHAGAVTLTDSIFSFPQGSIIVEGESADTCNFISDLNDSNFTEVKEKTVKPRVFPLLHRRGMSLLCTKSKPSSPYRAIYHFTIATPLIASMWVFEQGREWASPFRWRIDTCSWHEVSQQLHMHRSTAIDSTGTTFAWSSLGEPGKLKPGMHRLEIEVTAAKEDSAWLLAQDCFVLIPHSGTGRLAQNPFISQFEEPNSHSIYLWQGDTIAGSIPY